MTIIELLSQLRTMEVKLWAEGENLRYQAPKGKLEPGLLQEISRRKSEILAFLKQAGAEAKSVQAPIMPIQREGQSLAVSFSQQSLWFYAQMMPDSPVYNIPNAIRISGAMDLNRVHEAMDRVAKRHESLRTVFKNSGGKPAQEILTAASGILELKDLTGLGETERQAALQRMLVEESWKPFDLKNGPLWRITIFRLEEMESVMLLTIHHIISDAWSNGVFVKEFFAAYEDAVSGRKTLLPPPAVQFADYAAWQRERLSDPDIADSLLSYWKKQLENPTTLEFPVDLPRPAVQSFSGETLTRTLSEEMTQKVKDFCLSEDITVFMLFLTAFKILLYRCCGQEDILTGTVVANRNRPEIMGMIGFIMNTLVLRADLSGNPSFKELLSRIKSMTLDAYAHQEMPFDRLLEELKPERDPGRTPLFQVMYIHQSTGEVGLNVPGLGIRTMELENKAAPFELRMITEEKAGRISCRLDYCTDLFKESTIERILRQYERILGVILSDPGQTVNGFSLLSESELKKVTVDFNDTFVPFPKDRLIHQMFEDQVQKTPDAQAVVFEGESLTYSELNVRANKLAHYLIRHGVGPDVTVGVCLERSFEMVVALMGILKAGGAYVPFDPNYPKDRVEYMIRNACTKALVTRRDLTQLIPEFDGTLICIDQAWAEILGEKGGNPDVAVHDGNLAYLIYTSGSTGEPKGAMNTHLGMRNHKQWMQHSFQLTAQDKVIQKTPISFDVSVWEFFWPLVNGACLVMARPEGHKDPGYLIRTIAEEGITTLHFVPAMLSAFLDYPGAERCTSLRQVFCSGEALSMELQQRFFSKFNIPLYNVYGPAECADIATAWVCSRESGRNFVPIGKSIANVQVYILDSYMNPVPVGVVGELCIGGAGVGRGYINKPELTRERFIPDPFSREEGKYLYRTGDLGRFSEDGIIEYKGRCDFQVKIRGMRIELSEVERVLLRHPAVKECIVIAWEKQQGSVHLVCYAVCAPGLSVESAGLRDHLSKSLPEYMVPHIFVFMDQLPLLSNGKINRKALPEPVFEKTAEYAAPRNALEAQIAVIWEEELGISNVGIHDNFFEIGGHSLLLAKVHSRLNQEFGREFSLIDLFTHSTVSLLAKYISAEGEETGADEEQERIQKQKEARLLRKQNRREVSKHEQLV